MLTSHVMEEVEALCTKVAVVVRPGFSVYSLFQNVSLPSPVPARWNACRPRLFFWNVSLASCSCVVECVRTMTRSWDTSSFSLPSETVLAVAWLNR